MAWNQVRFRINGGKTAGSNERLLAHLRRCDRVLRSAEEIGHREDPLSRRFAPGRSDRTGGARGRICPHFDPPQHRLSRDNDGGPAHRAGRSNVIGRAENETRTVVQRPRRMAKACD